MSIHWWVADSWLDDGTDCWSRVHDKKSWGEDDDECIGRAYRLPEHGLATGCRSTVSQPVAGTRFGNRMAPAGGNTDPEMRSAALDPHFLGVCLALCLVSHLSH